jgi:uncharacterized protein
MLIVTYCGVGVCSIGPDLDAETALRILDNATERGPNLELLHKGKVAYSQLHSLIVELGGRH